MISIVIPTYNAERFLPGLLESIFRQGVEDTEVIIVDDCSRDRTVEIAKRYPVRVIELERNAGPARARNIGVREAKGDIILFLDADVVVMDGTIKEVRDHFERDPSARCVIGICETEPLNKGFVPKYMAMFEYIHLIGREGNRVSVFAPRCGAIRKDFFERIGGYNESYRGADVEDFELARRVNRTDPIILNEKIRVRHQFADFRQAVRNYFKRAVMWVHLFFREKKLDNAGPTSPSNGIAAMCAFFSLLSLFLIPFFPNVSYLTLGLLIVFLLANMRWLNFMRKEAGLSFALRALALNYILGIDIMLAVIYGVISYPFKKGAIKSI
jgi:glycosyltransferase involved in cell wall biosynthesis